MWPLAAIAAAQAASSIYQGISGSNASEKAANAQLGQEQKGLDFQKQVYGNTQANMAPYVGAGANATGELQNRLANYKQPNFNYTQPDFNFSTYSDPGAEYQMAQATKALNQSSLARGLAGGGIAKSIMAKNQEMAGTAYQGAYNRYLNNSNMRYQQAEGDYNRNYANQNNILDRYNTLSQNGQNAAANLGTINTSTGAQVGGQYGNMGSSMASGILGSNNAQQQAISGGLNGLGKIAGYSNGYSTQGNYFGNPGNPGNQYGGFNGMADTTRPVNTNMAQGLA